MFGLFNICIIYSGIGEKKELLLDKFVIDYLVIYFHGDYILQSITKKFN